MEIREKSSGRRKSGGGEVGSRKAEGRFIRHLDVADSYTLEVVSCQQSLPLPLS